MLVDLVVVVLLLLLIMLLMFIPSIFIYLGFLGYLNYILKISYVSKYRCFWPLRVSLYRRIHITVSASHIGDSLSSATKE
jgi:hypothetical protein